MPNGTTLRRTLLSVAALATLFLTQGASAQFQDSPPALIDDAQPSAGLAADSRLAEQYAGQRAGTPPSPSLLPRALPDAAPEAVPVTLPASAGFDGAAATSLQKEIDAALSAAAAGKQQPPAKRPSLSAPSPWRTAGLVVGALALLALVGVVLTLTLRQLRQDAQLRRRSHRRRFRRRDPVTTATVSAG